MRVMAYQYGCHKIDTIPPEAETQLKLANRFWNKLVEIENQYQEQKRQLWLKYPEIEEGERIIHDCLAEIEAIRKFAADRNQKEGVKKKLDPADKDKKAALLARIKEERARVKAAKERAYQDGADEYLKNLGLWCKEAVKSARQAIAEEGLYWGTYNAVAAHFDVARQKAAKEGAKLHFYRFDGSGTWTVQIQQENGEEPLTIGKLFSGAHKWQNMLRVGPVDFSDWDRLPRHERRRRARTTISIRIGSTAGREPVWLTLPMTMHRPLPADAEIKMVQVTRRRIASHYDYSVSFTVRLSENLAVPVNGQVAAIDLGWRVIGDELRVAAWKGSDGRSGELRLPASLVGEFDRVERIRSIRDRDFNAARQMLVDWLARNAAANAIPDWLRDATAHLAQWRSPGRLAALAVQWRDRRFDGDETAFAALEDWRRHDKHHWEFEANLRDQLVMRRREMYRVFAAAMARMYGAVVVEDMDLRQMTRRPEPGEENTLHDAARRHRVIAAPGILRECVKLAVLSAGGRYHEAPAGMTTRIHARCGEDNRTTDFVMEVAVVCPVCGVRYDQDFNACDNLLDWWRRGELLPEETRAVQ